MVYSKAKAFFDVKAPEIISTIYRTSQVLILTDNLLFV